MWLSLIQRRLLNSYYRHIDQLYYDLDLISFNSRLYNGEDHMLTVNAKKIVEALKRNIKAAINQGYHNSSDASMMPPPP
jgi:hypothetical protein